MGKLTLVSFRFLAPTGNPSQGFRLAATVCGGIDQGILLTLPRLHTPLGDRMMVGITFLGEPSFLLIICLIAGIWLLSRRRQSEAMTLAIAGIGAIGLNFLLKNLLTRARPTLWQRTVDVSFYSFPSGHAIISLVI